MLLGGTGLGERDFCGGCGDWGLSDLGLGLGGLVEAAFLEVTFEDFLEPADALVGFFDLLFGLVELFSSLALLPENILPTRTRKRGIHCAGTFTSTCRRKASSSSLLQ